MPNAGVQAEYERIRRRYLRLGLWTAIAGSLFGLQPESLATAGGVGRLALAGVAAGALWWSWRGGEVRRTGQVVLVLLAVGVLAVAVLQAEAGGWPEALGFLPALLGFGALVVGGRTSSTLMALVITAVLGTYGLEVLPRPAYWAVHLTNWMVAVLGMQWFVQRLAIVLGAGDAELAVAASAMERAQRDCEDLSDALARRVRGALDDLDRALAVGPEEALRSADALSRTLAESRRRLPAEPPVVAGKLAEHIETLTYGATAWTGRLLLVVGVVQVVRAALLPPAMLGPAGDILLQGGLILAAMPAALVSRTRTWPLRWAGVGGGWVVLYAIGSVFMWRWISAGVVPPPPLAMLCAAAVSLAFSLGPGVAFVALSGMAGVSFVAIAEHPGGGWTGVVVMAAVYALCAWTVWRWPRELLAALVLRRDAAAGFIQNRRRLVATLFHDLANPLVVILGDLEDRGAAGARNMECARHMAGRMRAVLDAAGRSCPATHSVDAVRLCDEVAALFRDRMRRKGIELRTDGPPAALVRCDESLLRDSVLANLMSNALKFSPPGGAIDLCVRVDEKGVAVVVNDRGPGLPAEVEEALARGTTAPSRKGTEGEEGSGYGLLLARDYLGNMGGRLEFTPRVGGGLSAVVRLPSAA